MARFRSHASSAVCPQACAETRLPVQWLIASCRNSNCPDVSECPRCQCSAAILNSCAGLSLVTILSGCGINNFAGQSAKSVCYNLVAMFDLFRMWLGAVLRGFRTHRSLMLENLALRQQLAVFKRQQPRPRLGAIDKLCNLVAM